MWVNQKFAKFSLNCFMYVHLIFHSSNSYANILTRLFHIENHVFNVNFVHARTPWSLICSPTFCEDTHLTIINSLDKYMFTPLLIDQIWILLHSLGSLYFSPTFLWVHQFCPSPYSSWINTNLIGHSFYWVKAFVPHFCMHAMNYLHICQPRSNKHRWFSFH